MLRRITDIFTAVALFSATVGSSFAEPAKFTFSPFDHFNPPQSCVDKNGRKIEFYPYPYEHFKKSGEFLAYASSFLGNPYIAFDQNILPQTPKQFQNFTYLHECGHHLNGDLELTSAEYNKQRYDLEHKADCFAVDVLIKDHAYNAQDFKTIKDTFWIVSLLGAADSEIKKRQNLVDKCIAQSPNQLQASLTTQPQ